MQAGFITVYPCGARDLVSSVNFALGQTVSNAVIATVSADGNVCFFSSATTDLVVDINGWIATGSDFNGVTPVRVFDTRAGQSPERRPRCHQGEDRRQHDPRSEDGRHLRSSAAHRCQCGVAQRRRHQSRRRRLRRRPTPVEPATSSPASTTPLVRPFPTPSSFPFRQTGTVCFFSMVPTDLVVDLNGWFSTVPTI